MEKSWRIRSRKRGRRLEQTSYKYAEPWLSAARQLATQEHTSFAVLVERLTSADDNEAKALRKQLRIRVKALGGNINNASTSDGRSIGPTE